MCRPEKPSEPGCDREQGTGPPLYGKVWARVRAFKDNGGGVVKFKLKHFGRLGKFPYAL